MTVKRCTKSLKWVPFVAAVAMLCGCSGAAPSGSTPSVPSTKAVSKPSAVNAKSARRDYTIAAPPRWSQKQVAYGSQLLDPDGTVRVDVLALDADDLDQAIDEAIRLTDLKLPERRRHSGSGDERFDKVRVAVFVSDDEKTMAQIMVRRRKKRAYIFVLRGPMKDLSRRGAEIYQLVSSLEVKGAERLKLHADQRKPLTDEKIEQWLSFIDAMREKSGVPGFSVALVDHDRVVTRGLGNRRLGKDPVDADTQFMIGSITKSFSTLMLATLVDAGKVDWQAPVTSVYPSFKLGSKKATESIQMKHLFCACTGLPRNDFTLLFEFAQKKPKDVFFELKTLAPTTAFGETFQYNNQLTAAGGYIAGHVAFPSERNLHKAYERVLLKRVLEPLGMSRTTLRPPSPGKRGNFATPHRLSIRGETEPVPLSQERFAGYVAPAGALWSTANDMARYVALQLKKGVLANGKRLVSVKGLQTTQTRGVKITDTLYYGLGWMIGEKHGLATVGHDGGTLGFGSHMMFFPTLNVGYFVVGNSSTDGRVLRAARERLIELLFDVDLHAEKDALAAFSERKRQQAITLSKIADEPVPAKLLGKYKNADLGSLDLRRKHDAVVADVGEWKTKLAVLKRSEGPRRLIMLGGPFAGTSLRYELDPRPALLITDGQHEYRFEK